MVEKGWCQLLPTLLHTTENDTREKVLQALHVMVAGCKSEFKKPHVQDSLNKLKLEWLKDANAPDVHDASEYAGILVQLVTDLLSKLTWQRCADAKDNPRMKQISPVEYRVRKRRQILLCTVVKMRPI